MALITIILGLVIILLLTIAGLILNQFRRHAKYFSDRGVPYLAKQSFLMSIGFLKGNVRLTDVELKFYKEAKKTGAKFCGYSDFFTSPAYFIYDLDLLKHIYVKDFEHFVDRRKISTPHNDLLMGRMLISLESDQWRDMRKELTPAFTTGKIKRMFDIFNSSSTRMCDYVNTKLSSNGDFDIYDGLSKFAMDVIASCAFGVDCKTFELEPGVSSEFEQMGRRLSFPVKISAILKFIIFSASPKLAKLLGIQPMDQVPQQYFYRVVTQVMKHRRETGERKNDFLQLMLDAQKGLLKDDQNSKEPRSVHDYDSSVNINDSSASSLKFNDVDIVANCVLFLIGGFDTTKSLLAFCAYQLALEPEIQEKLYQEVKKCTDANDGELTYDGLLEMGYLDRFVTETLRYLPPATRTERRCTKNYKIPGTDVVIEKGTTVVLPMYGVHHDPEIYDNPEKFDPDRFLPEQKNNRHSNAFTPFGHGPRNCIGMRFALTEVKTVIATLVHTYKLEPCRRTDIPLQLEPATILKPVNGLWINMSLRKKKTVNG